MAASSLWLATVLCLATGVLFALVSTIFTVVNAVGSPAETLSGLPGLIFWNGMGALFLSGSLVTWLVQFNTHLRRNVLSEEEQEHGWTSRDRATVGLSFYLAASSLGLFLLHIILTTIAIKRPWVSKSEEQASAAAAAAAMGMSASGKSGLPPGMMMGMGVAGTGLDKASDGLIMLY